MYKFSVLMSVYIREKPEYMRECFNSLLKQTVKADEWVIIEDGPLTSELYQVLNEYKNAYPNLIKRVAFKENRGLGPALRDGIVECTYELIARMDTDDIAREDRFEKQLAMFEKDSKLDICGSNMLEFDMTIDRVLSERKVPITDQKIKKYQKRRDAFNHPTVMYKKSMVLQAGNYKDCLLMEDTMLWVDMILAGAKCANVDDNLVYYRTGNNMYQRRGGFSYFKKYKAGRKKVYQTGYISWVDYIYTIFIQFIVAMLPNRLRAFFYKKLLRH